MKIIRNETRIRRLKTAGNVLAAVGMIILLGGLVMAFVIRDPNLIIYQLLALAVDLSCHKFRFISATAMDVIRAPIFC